MIPEWIDAGMPEETQELSSSGPRPVFADFPQSERPTESPQHRKNGVLPVLGIGGVVLALVILALILPPISLFDILQDDNPDTRLAFINLSAASPRLEADGLTIEVNEIAGDYGVRVVSISSENYLRHQIPSEGWFCGTSVSARPLASRVYSLTQTGTPPHHFVLSIIPVENAPQGTLAMYRWNMTLQAWELIPSLLMDHQVVGEMAHLPPCVALFVDTESSIE